jgi:hypothetical protein
VEEIAARHVGYPVYLKERKVRPTERDTMFYCYKERQTEPKPPKPAPPVSITTTILDQIHCEANRVASPTLHFMDECVGSVGQKVETAERVAAQNLPSQR